MRILTYCILVLAISLPAMASARKERAETPPAPAIVEIRETMTPEQIDSLVDIEANSILADHPGRDYMGFSHVLWQVKKRIYKEKYHMDWRSPAEENPGIIFD